MSLQANAIIDVATAQAMIKLLGTADVSIIEKWINLASDHIEKYCCTKFINQSITEVANGSGSVFIIPRFAPVRTITEITYYYNSLSPQIQTITDFVVDVEAGIIQALRSIFPEGFQNVQIKYTTGHGATMADLSGDVVGACILLVEKYYKVNTADFTTTFGEADAVHTAPDVSRKSITDLLAPYKRTVL